MSQADERSPLIILNWSAEIVTSSNDIFVLEAILQVYVNLHCSLLRKISKSLVFCSYPQRDLVIFPSAMFCSAKNATVVRKLAELILVPFLQTKTLSYFRCIVLSLVRVTCLALFCT